MRQIWKFPVDFGKFTIKSPPICKYLDVQIQKDKPYLWVMVDINGDFEEYNFVVYGTGHSIPDAISIQKHIGTFQMGDGNLIWHLFTDN